MTDREKALAYDRALKRVKNIMAGKYETTFIYSPTLFEEIFPELKEVRECENEIKIKDSLMQYLWDLWHKEIAPLKPDISTCDRWIDWLEKQGQKPTDKVEQKFHEGQWVKGDIVSDGKNVLIVDGMATYEGKPVIESWYFADSEKFYGVGTSETDLWYADCFRLASTAERAYLFLRMREADYEWDADKKELKKIEQESADKVDIPMTLDEAIEHCKEKSCGDSACAHQHRQLENWLVELKEYKEQKPAENKDAEQASEEYREMREECGIKDPVMLNEIEEAYYQGATRQKSSEWSEEDGQILSRIITHIEALEHFVLAEQDAYILGEEITWLKSLKNHVQPKQEWTKYDEERYKSCLKRLGTGNPEQPETINSKWFKEYVNDWRSIMKKLKD